MCGWALGWDSSVNPDASGSPETCATHPGHCSGGHRGFVGAGLPVSLTRAARAGLGSPWRRGGLISSLCLVSPTVRLWVHVVLPVNLWAGPPTIPSGKISFVCVLCMAPSPALCVGPTTLGLICYSRVRWVGIMALTEPWV